MKLSPTVILVLLVVFVVVTGGAALGAYGLTRQFVAESPIPLPPLPDLSARPTVAPVAAAVNPTSPPTQAPASAAGSTVSAVTATRAPTLAPTTAPPAALTRVTVLVMGIDQRKGETGNFHTDTMIVLSLDPLAKTGVILSIPRDIYLQIPDTRVKARINTAFDVGNSINYPGGAGQLSVKTVQNVIGVRIHHYVVLNFDVFNAVIDALGTIKVCPTSVIHDNQYPDGSYGYITVHFDPGCQELQSVRLLQYARVRHNAGDDFGRSERQQEVIKAVREKILSLGGIGALLTQAGTLWDTVKTSVQTDMSFEQMIQLAQIAQTIPRDNIRSALLTDRDNYILPAVTAQNEQVFTPNYDKIPGLMESLFSAPAAPVTANQAADDGQGVIQVLNGAGVDGLAKKTIDQLKAGGLNVLDAAKNADVTTGVYSVSVIRVYNGRVATARKLAALLGLDAAAIKVGDKGPAGVDIELIVGKDRIGR